jgi:hypothetical protein
MRAVVIGEQPRPRVLAFGVAADSVLGRAIASRSGWVKFPGDEATGVRQRDYDVAIAFGLQLEFDHHLHVIHFGGTPIVSATVGDDDEVFWMAWKPGAHAERFVIGKDAVEAGVVELASRTIVPEPGSDYRTLFWRATRSPSDPWRQPKFHPFVSEFHGGATSGYIASSDDQIEGVNIGRNYWMLPEVSDDVAIQWIDAAFAYWGKRDREAFPVGIQWMEDPTWMTQEELDISAAMSENERRGAEILLDLENERSRLSELLLSARKAGNRNERRLLTDSGDALVDEVAKTLSEFGFFVQNGDELAENTASKSEDLRITLDDGWTCLAEVKGYQTRNAKEGDLLQLNNAAELYAAREGRRPDARWYVVNQSYSKPPDSRLDPLQGASRLPLFESQNGLVIDTRELFRLRQAVSAGRVSVEAARDMLLTVGVFRFDSADRTDEGVSEEAPGAES